jgi:hypothetical protein
MNERIRELAVQAEIYAGDLIDQGADYNQYPRYYTEKFAELIVKECAKRIDYWESRQGEHCDDLLKHFGVEE